MQRISFKSPYPVFAGTFLDLLYREADNIIREETRVRTSLQIGYIERQLGRVSVIEYRKVLTDLLASQEKSMMMLNVELPYVASVIEPPFVSELPTHPKPITALLVSLVLGIFLGVFLALALAAWGWGEDQRRKTAALPAGETKK